MRLAYGRGSWCCLSCLCWVQCQAGQLLVDTLLRAMVRVSSVVLAPVVLAPLVRPMAAVRAVVPVAMRVPVRAWAAVTVTLVVLVTAADAVMAVAVAVMAVAVMVVAVLAVPAVPAVLRSCCRVDACRPAFSSLLADIAGAAAAAAAAAGGGVGVGAGRHFDCRACNTLMGSSHA